MVNGFNIVEGDQKGMPGMDSDVMKKLLEMLRNTGYNGLQDVLKSLLGPSTVGGPFNGYGGLFGSNGTFGSGITNGGTTGGGGSGGSGGTGGIGVVQPPDR